MIKLSNDINLRPISLTDHESLSKLMNDIYPPVYNHLWLDNSEWYLNKLYSKENMATELNNPDSYYYFVQYKSNTVGILKVIVNESMPGAENAMVKLQRIYLAPSLQGKGIGKLLIKWVEEMFCKEHSLPLWLEAMDSQDTAIGFYEKLGFVKCGTFTLEFEMMKEKYRGMFRMIKEIHH
ncbi:GNAT family N-acetyltransferase [Galbibacter sp. EGI 63066]|uniref:GNAT family N-acetyltransferase n=1 Tax=Galbibacter sp. EGI 63066 TaxID=2993559 RepID=UPI002248E096|nr:GNAT family N-acetyltransferase [Galbibacter sp. EGI 63066]MCX2680309.1 GNAT family N-acetyltransferase [Galbibacter sp. EGI 63066]